MLGLKLNHVSKRGHSSLELLPVDFIIQNNLILSWNIFRVAGPLWGESTGILTGVPLTLVTQNFFDLRLNTRLNIQSRRRWFETPSRSLWRQCDPLGIIPDLLLDYFHHLFDHISCLNGFRRKYISSLHICCFKWNCYIVIQSRFFLFLHRWFCCLLGLTYHLLYCNSFSGNSISNKKHTESANFHRG